MRIDKENKKKLQVMALKCVSGKCSHIDAFRAMGYTMKIQSRMRTRKGRLKRAPAPTDPTRKVTWVMLEENRFTRSRYWIGIPRDIALKALVLGCLPSLEETKPVRIAH